MVCIFRNPSDMDVDTDSDQADIRQIADMVLILSNGYGLPAIFLDYPRFINRIIQEN
jgi:hypothetical protein